jgi:hypothetical protein
MIMLLAAFIVICICATGIIILRPAEEEKKITITLADLSAIWTKYNDTYEAINIAESKDNIAPLYGEKQETNDETAKESEVRDPDSDISSPAVGPIKFFWESCITPYEHVFQRQGVADVVKTLVEIIEKYGNCPSVSTNKKDSESADLFSVKDNLAQVPLKDHTYAVAYNLVEEVKTAYNDYENLIPKAVVAGLAHDIGKIPEFRDSRAYNTSEHHLISALKLNEILAGKELYWLKHVIKAVEEHHICSNDEFTILLKKADKMARQTELMKFTKEYSIMNFGDWFNTETFYREMEPKINYSPVYGKWDAFTFRGIIYCKPDFIYNTLQKLCKEAKALDLSFIYKSEKENALRKVVNKLREADLVPGLLAPNQIARKFEIKWKMGSPFKNILIPLKIANFYDMEKIEARKTDFMQMLERVTPVGKG